MRLPRLPDRLWILVAHEAGARIFYRRDPGSALVLIDRIDRPIGRAKNRELASDRPGHEESWSPSKQRHGFDRQMEPTEKNALEFAREIALRLERDTGAFDHLVLVAGPKFLGMIRCELGASTTARVARTLDENLGNLEDREIFSHLGGLLADYERSHGLTEL